MSAELDEGARPRKRWVTYTAVGLLALGLGTVMVIQFDNHRSNSDARVAEQKAGELNDRLTAAGVAPLDEDTVVQFLGSDGGAICAKASSLGNATANLSSANGAAGPGLRVSLVDERRLAADRLVIEIYCPENLDDFNDFVAALRLDSTTTTGQTPAATPG